LARRAIARILLQPRGVSYVSRTVADVQALPKVTPYLLRRADSMCARRLAREVEGGERSSDPVNRSRLRDAFLAAARAAHAEARAPVAADFVALGRDLEPEEQAVLAHAAGWYVRMFGDRAVRYEDHGLDAPSVSPRRRLRIGGWVDLAVVGVDGARELRHLELWDGRAPVDDPLELESVKVAVLRLSGWVVDQPLRVIWADLVRGSVRERTVAVTAELPELTRWFEERVEVVRGRIAVADAQMGADCATCKFVAACPEHPTGAHFSGRKGDVLPGILAVTPTALDTWRRCPREWRSAHVLSIPSSDDDSGSAHGQQVHDLLRLIHEQGSCHDPVHVDDALVGHGLESDDRIRNELGRHARRCPVGAIALGHEITRARFHRKPFPAFMASARLDALWRHDGYLAAHDYKTGQQWSDRVADDSQARLQAWVLAPFADSLGLRVRIVFEHLAAEIVDDAEPFEPDADDLAAIEEELRGEVEAIRAETAFAGVADAEVCGRCRYRSICPDSAVTGVPNWPTVE
jgi:hypothetical protein